MRIRSIKPEFWRSRHVAQLSWDLRLLFIGLWSYVDDNGVGVDDPWQITADVFPVEPDPAAARIHVERGLATLSREVREPSPTPFIVRYVADGRPFLYITGWPHQRIDKPSKARYPLPTEGDLTRANQLSKSDPPETLASTPETLAPGTGEQGNRGTGSSAPSGAGAVAPTEIHPGVIVAAWVETYEAHAGTKASNGMRGQVGREARQLLANEADPALVLQAARDVGEKGRSTLEREYGPLAARARLRPVPDADETDEYVPPQAPREVVFDPDPAAMPRWHAEQRAKWLAERGRA